MKDWLESDNFLLITIHPRILIFFCIVGMLKDYITCFDFIVHHNIYSTLALWRTTSCCNFKHVYWIGPYFYVINFSKRESLFYLLLVYLACKLFDLPFLKSIWYLQKLFLEINTEAKTKNSIFEIISVDYNRLGFKIAFI